MRLNISAVPAGGDNAGWADYYARRYDRHHDASALALCLWYTFLAMYGGEYKAGAACPGSAA